MTKKIISCLMALLIMLVPGAVAFAARLSASASPSSMSAGGMATITVNVTNDGASVMENISIVSESGVAFPIGSSSIQPGSSQSYSQTMYVSEDMLGKPITMTVSWTEDGVAKSDTVSAVISLPNVGFVSVSRTVDKRNAKPGEIIKITYTISNGGSVAAHSITLKDSKIKSGEMAAGITLAPGESHQIVYEYEMKSATVTSEPKVTYTIDGSSDVLTATCSPVTLGLVNSKIEVEVTQGESTPDGTRFTIKLINNGNQKVSGIKVTNDLNERIDDGSFSLAVGEEKTLIYNANPQTLRYVIFYITGTYQNSSKTETYSDKTKSFAVYPYVDPSLIKLDFLAVVESPLDANNSMRVLFTLNNTSTLTYKNVVLSEEQIGEVYRCESLQTGTVEVPVTVYVEQERELHFTLTFEDHVGNPYSYTTNITAAKIGGEEKPQETPGIEVGVLGEKIGTSLSKTLTTLFVILAVLTIAAVTILIILTYIEKRNRRIAEERRRKRAAQKRRMEREGRID